MFNVYNKLKHIYALKTKDVYKMLDTHSEKTFCIKHKSEHNIIGNDWILFCPLKFKTE